MVDLILQSDAELDQDRAAIQFIVFGLLVVAALLGLLTAWYWKHTDPRKATSSVDDSGNYNDLDYDEYYDDEYADDGYEAPVYSENSRPTHLPGDKEDIGRPDNNVRPRSNPRRGRKQARSASSDDAWATLTGAQEGEPDHR